MEAIAGCQFRETVAASLRHQELGRKLLKVQFDRLPREHGLPVRESAERRDFYASPNQVVVTSRIFRAGEAGFIWP